MLHGLLLIILIWTLGGFALLLLTAATVPILHPSRELGPAPALPRVSIVVPARDEARSIREAVRSHLAQDYPDWEVIVIDDQSTDGTGAILDALAQTHARLRVIHNTELPAGWLGKPHALQLGADAATGDLLLFVDADVRYAPGLLRAAVGRLEQQGWDFLSLLPRVEMEGFWERVLMPFVPGAFYTGLGLLANMDAVPWMAAGGGPGSLIRRDVYRAVGGHAALASSVIDDVRLALLTKQHGYCCRLVRAEDLVRLRMYHGFREVFDGFTKNVSHVYYGRTGLLLFALTAFFVTAQAVPPGVLLAAAVVHVPPPDLALAGGAVAVALATRLVLQRVLRAPLWAAATYPLQAVVWAAITTRSFYWRLVKNEVVWRGRRYDAGQARF
ncbi:MAG TPA: glycosyltransferase [Vicinamibacterales bacterium]|nr:glycosyltransferase [Vicinamibacterales bacterium]